MNKIVSTLLLIPFAHATSAQEEECKPIDRYNLYPCMEKCVEKALADGGSWETLGSCIVGLSVRAPDYMAFDWRPLGDGHYSKVLDQVLVCARGEVIKTPELYVQCNEGSAEISYFGCFGTPYKITTYGFGGDFHFPPRVDGYEKIDSYVYEGFVEEVLSASVRIPLGAFLSVDAIGFEQAGLDNAPQSTFSETRNLKEQIVTDSEHCNF